ncbi:hypothetical protein Agub_g8848 [Astrephomene gubernaculifera]|uniref:Uncharacterized protein n=1 Tax=Astrephomene gubernaculifera TaxID=47775 RepID=A0AAD3DV12_9CHLO|nr:hypothetical protein Agub_g8848 [Astrephomene gubernaculifera]
MADGPVFASYMEAHLAGKASAPGEAGSRASTEAYAYGPAGSAQRLREPRNYVVGDPLPAKPISVLHRPVKQPSAKNAENIDTQHERDKAAFERRASGYRRLAKNGYHHHAPPGSILTTFERGHIVDRGRGKSAVQEARGVYDPVCHSYRVAPASTDAAASERPCSAPHRRAEGSGQQEPPQHRRNGTAAEHKLLQVYMGKYNPLTHEYTASPEPEYASRKEKEFERQHGLGQGMRRVRPFKENDPITWEDSKHSRFASAGGAASVAPGAAEAAAAAQQQRPSSAPGRNAASRKPMAGASWGTYNPITHEWQVPPSDPKFEKQEALVERRLGVSGKSAGRTQTPVQQGVYNPILNTWTVPPANPRVIDGLSFMPATLFSRPTAATIRM